MQDSSSSIKSQNYLNVSTSESKHHVPDTVLEARMLCICYRWTVSHISIIISVLSLVLSGVSLTSILSDCDCGKYVTKDSLQESGIPAASLTGSLSPNVIADGLITNRMIETSTISYSKLSGIPPSNLGFIDFTLNRNITSVIRLVQVNSECVNWVLHMYISCIDNITPGNFRVVETVVNRINGGINIWESNGGNGGCGFSGNGGGANTETTINPLSSNVWVKGHGKIYSTCTILELISDS